MKGCFLSGVLCVFSATAGAETFAVWVEGPMGPQERAFVEQGARQALRELSSLQFQSFAFEERRCLDDGCRIRRCENAASDHVLWVTESEGSLNARWFTRTDHRLGAPKKVASPFNMNDAVKELVRSLLPPHTVKGFARVETEGASVWRMRVDGRPVKFVSDNGWVVPAGQHTLDVELANGESVLFALRLQEAEQAQLRIQPWASAVNPSARGRVQRAISYALWMTGAVAISGSLVAATLSKEASSQLTPCSSLEKNCLTVQEAQSIQYLAQARAQNANVLLISGAALATAGVGLFVWQWVIP